MARRLVLVGLIALLGCGGGDGGDGGGGASPRTEESTGIERPRGLAGEAAQAADVVVELLEQPSGEEACYSLLGTDYVEALGGQETCARRFEPVVTGEFV